MNVFIRQHIPNNKIKIHNSLKIYNGQLNILKFYFLMSYLTKKFQLSKHFPLKAMNKQCSLNIEQMML